MCMLNGPEIWSLSFVGVIAAHIIVKPLFAAHTLHQGVAKTCAMLMSFTAQKSNMRSRLHFIISQKCNVCGVKLFYVSVWLSCYTLRLFQGIFLCVYVQSTKPRDLVFSFTFIPKLWQH